MVIKIPAARFDQLAIDEFTVKLASRVKMHCFNKMFKAARGMLFACPHMTPPHLIDCQFFGQQKCHWGSASIGIGLGSHDAKLGPTVHQQIWNLAFQTAQLRANTPEKRMNKFMKQNN